MTARHASVWTLAHRHLAGNALVEFVLRQWLGLRFVLAHVGAFLSQSGGARAFIKRGGEVASPRWLRIWRAAPASVMKAMIRISPTQGGQTSGKTSWIRASSSAQA